MNIKIPVKEISLGKEKVSLYLQGPNRFAEWNQELFKHLWFLVSKLPALSDPYFIKPFSEISNFFWKGLEFQCISSIREYQQYYRTRIQLEKRHPADIFPYRLTDYKIFDVSAMHDPKIEEDQLIYFVYNAQNGIPYRVICPFPYPFNSTTIHYQVLPTLDEF